MFGSLESILRWLKSSCCILRIAQWELIFPNFLHEVISSMSYFTQPKTQNLRLLADYLRKYKFIQFSENLLSLFINEVACKSSFFFFFFGVIHLSGDNKRTYIWGARIWNPRIKLACLFIHALICSCHKHVSRFYGARQKLWWVLGYSVN